MLFVIGVTSAVHSWYIHGKPIEIFLVPDTGPQLVYQKPWLVCVILSVR